jgi:hypothetical protein
MLLGNIFANQNVAAEMTGVKMVGVLYAVRSPML